MLRKVLYIDLSKGESWIEEKQELFEKWMGGTGVGIRLLMDECPTGADPFSPDAPIILSIGPLNGIFPVATKAVATFKSPLTGELGESYAGGRLHLAMRFAGHEAIVIKGKAQVPSYIAINDAEVKIKDATSIWGIDAQTTGVILREREPGVGRRSIIRIGPAGEAGVRYAGVVVDTYRHFGRLGLGAVFGSKMLKALVISGTETVEVPDIKRYKEVYGRLYKTAVQTDVMEKYHDIGTSVNINVLNWLKGLPTKNFQLSSFQEGEKISGEMFAEKYLIRRLSCAGCPIGCVHIAALKSAFSSHHEFEVKKVSYDYEPIYSLGSNLGVASAEGILQLIDVCEKMGLDVMSAGVVLSWATEALEKGLITSKETLDVSLQWNNVDGYSRAWRISSRPPMSSTLRLPREWIMRPPDTAARIMPWLWAETRSRISHRSRVHCRPARRCATFTPGQRRIQHRSESSKETDGCRVDGKGDHQRGTTPRGVFNSLVGCLFARGVYTGENIIDSLGAMGIMKTKDDLFDLGQRIFEEKYKFKVREGFDIPVPRCPRGSTRPCLPWGKPDTRDGGGYVPALSED